MNQLGRILWLSALAACGLLPSLAFFAWIERNCSLPWVAIELGWPWVNWIAEPTWLLAAFDITLVLAFGALHTFLAQEPVRRASLRLIPDSAYRAFYVIVAGLSVTGVMGFWQSTGIVLWTLPVPRAVLWTLSIVCFWGFLIWGFSMMFKHDLGRFLGVRQIYSPAPTNVAPARSDASPEVIVTGFYARVRHPMYLLTCLAIAVTPFMTLDRTLVLAGLLLYLAFGIPIEERKLVAEFGESYRAYRRRVPALYPWARP